MPIHIRRPVADAPLCIKGMGSPLRMAKLIAPTGCIHKVAIFVITVGVILATAPFAVADERTRQMENHSELVKQIDSGALGTDPHRFDTAESMISNVPCREFDPTAAQLIAMLNEMAPDPQVLPESALFRFGLIKLTPYRHAEQLQDALKNWCRIFLGRMNNAAHGELPHEARTAFSNGNRLYKAKNFNAASRDYISALRRFPRYDDARNNLALSQLHLGYDVWAQLEWMILSERNERYVPALINLSVLYERMGMTDQSRKTAHRAMGLQNQAAPAALFNVAWHHNRDGELTAAHEILARISEFHIDTKFNAFYALNLKQMQFANAMAAAESSARAARRESRESIPGQAKETGLQRVVDTILPYLGFPKILFNFDQAGLLKKAGVIGLFLLVPFLLTGIFTRVSPVQVLIFITPVAAWYPFYWGLPDGDWISFLWPGIYLLLFSGLYLNWHS